MKREQKRKSDCLTRDNHYIISGLIELSDGER